METIKNEKNLAIWKIIENGGNITALLTLLVAIVSLFFKFIFILLIYRFLYIITSIFGF